MQTIVPILAPLLQVDWDKSNPDLLESVDTLRAYHFPNIDANPKQDIKGYIGTPVYIEFPFRVESTDVSGVTPTIINVGCKIVASKTGEEDFILQEKTFDTQSIRKLSGVQTINIENEKPFSGVASEYKTDFIKRDTSFDSGSMKGFLFRYSFCLSYEFWLKLIQDSERINYQIFSDIESPTKDWSTLQANGWSLKFRFLATIKGYEDFEEVFDVYFPITVLALGDASDLPPTFTCVTKYFDNETGFETGGLSIGKKTRIESTFTGDFSTPPVGFDRFVGYIFADVESSAGVINREFVSTEENISDSSFSATTPDPLATSSIVTDNVTLDIFDFTKVVLNTIYNDDIKKLGLNNQSVLFYPNLSAVIN